MGEIEKAEFGVDMTLLESMDITIDYFKEGSVVGNFFQQRSSVQSFNNGEVTGYAALCQQTWLGKEKESVDMSVAYSKVNGKDWVLRLNSGLDLCT